MNQLFLQPELDSVRIHAIFEERKEVQGDRDADANTNAVRIGINNFLMNAKFGSQKISQKNTVSERARFFLITLTMICDADVHFS